LQSNGGQKLIVTICRIICDFFWCYRFHRVRSLFGAHIGTSLDVFQRTEIGITFICHWIVRNRKRSFACNQEFKSWVWSNRTAAIQNVLLWKISHSN
jgi:hypothetical protein